MDTPATSVEAIPVIDASPDHSRWRKRISGAIILEVVLVIGFVVAANLVILAVDRTPLRAVVGIPLLLFFPGYAVLTVLFPGRPTRSRYGTFDPLSRSISGVERVALSFGISLALLPPIALALWTVDDRGFGLRVLLGVLTAITVLGMIGGVYRRLQLSRRQRYRVPFGYAIAELRTNSFAGGALETILRFGMVLSIIIAMITIGYAVLVPNHSAAYTGVSLLTRDANGELTSANYSTATTGSGTDLILAIENHEQTTVSYTAVVRLQRVQTGGNRVTVRSSSELRRLQTTVSTGETTYLPHSVSPPMNGEPTRLQYLIYKGDPPATTTKATAYRTLFLWVTPQTQGNQAGQGQGVQGGQRETNATGADRTARVQLHYTQRAGSTTPLSVIN